jgi:hypothetical protein
MGRMRHLYQLLYARYSNPSLYLLTLVPGTSYIRVMPSKAGGHYKAFYSHNAQVCPIHARPKEEGMYYESTSRLAEHLMCIRI